MLAAAYAFAARWLVTVWLVVLALGLLAEPVAPLRRLAERVTRPLGPPSRPVDAAGLRFATILAVGLLTGASVLLWIGIEPVGWLLVLAVAAAAALTALAQICIGCEVYALLRRRFGRTAPKGS